MDHWLTAVEADTSADTLEEKVVRTSPRSVDAC